MSSIPGNSINKNQSLILPNKVPTIIKLKPMYLKLLSLFLICFESMILKFRVNVYIGFVWSIG